MNYYTIKNESGAEYGFKAKNRGDALRLIRTCFVEPEKYTLRYKHALRGGK